MIKVIVNGKQDGVIFNNVVGYVDDFYKSSQDYYVVSFLEEGTPRSVYDLLSPRSGTIKRSKFRNWCVLPKMVRKYINIKRVK